MTDRRWWCRPLLTSTGSDDRQFARSNAIRPPAGGRIGGHAEHRLRAADAPSGADAEGGPVFCTRETS